MFLPCICCQATANEFHMCLATEDPQPNNIISSALNTIKQVNEFHLFYYYFSGYYCFIICYYTGQSGRKVLLPGAELIKCIDPNEGEAL